MQKTPRLGGRGLAIADVEVYARPGKTRLAPDTLGQVIDKGWRMAWGTQGERSPHRVSLLDEPEYEAMMAKIKADVAAQLAQVREMEKNGKLAAIPEPNAN